MTSFRDINLLPISRDNAFEHPNFSNFDDSYPELQTLNNDDVILLGWYENIIKLNISLNNIINEIDNYLLSNKLLLINKQTLNKLKNIYTRLQEYISPFIKINDIDDNMYKIKKIHDVINNPEYNISIPAFKTKVDEIDRIIIEVNETFGNLSTDDSIQRFKKTINKIHTQIIFLFNLSPTNVIKKYIIPKEDIIDITMSGFHKNGGKKCSRRKKMRIRRRVTKKCVKKSCKRRIICRHRRRILSRRK